MHANAFDHAAKKLAQNLLDQGLVPIQRIVNPEGRSLIVWGLMRIDYSCSSGQVSVGLVAKGLPNSEWRMIWQVSVAGCGLEFDQVLSEFCEWSVKKDLKAYGPSTDLAAKVMKDELLKHSNVLNLYSEWRRSYNHWLLPSEVSRLARRTYGAWFSTMDFNRIAENYSLVKEVATSTPNLLPILGWIMNQRTPSIEKQLFGRCVTIREFFDGFRQGLINSEQNPESVKSFSPAAWRLLVKQPATIVRNIVRPDLPGIPPMLNLLHLLARTGEESLPKAFVGQIRVYIDRYTQQAERADQVSRYLRLFIRVIKKSQRNGAAILNIKNQATLIGDWLSIAGLDHGYPLRNSTWTSLLRNQAEWHALARWNHYLPYDQSAECFWESVLGQMDIDGCSIYPLNSSHELHREGSEMRHCVSTYRNDCEKGVSRIFSIKSAKGRSTLELRLSQGTWDISQHRGMQNDNPPIEHQRVAVKFLYLYQDKSTESEADKCF